MEVDGPNHFLGPSTIPSGATTLKRRQLRRLGWRLLSVPYWEWMELGVSDERRAAYLLRLLESID